MINLLEKYNSEQIMKSLHTILIAIGIGAIPVGFDRWQPLYNSILESIHPNLPDVLLIALICIGIIGGILKITKKQTLVYEHSSDINRYRTHIDNLRIELKSSLEGQFARGFYDIVNNSSRREQIFQHLITWYKFKGGELPKLLDDLLLVNMSKKHEIEIRLANYIEKEFHKSFQHFYNSLTSKNPIGICDECKIDYFDSDKDEMIDCLKFYHKHEDELRKIFD
ncbi:hypothetical protein NMT12_190026 [metagenome]